MLDRWCDLGKPLFMVPKEFKDRILINMENEVKLNYLKWLTHGLDIDIFEIMSMLIVYSRCELEKKLQLIFQLYCYNNFLEMNKFELSFMINKICCSIATTLQIKKSYLIDYVQEFEAQIMENNPKISMDNFVVKMSKLFKGFDSSFIGGLETKINLFS